MRRWTIMPAMSCLLLIAVAPAFGQKPKSQKELDALTAIQNATDPDARLKAIDSLLTNFADTEYKNMVLEMAVQTARQKGDFTVVSIWADRALQSNPKDYLAMIALAEGLAQSTREFDLDKDEKLTKADKYAQGAIDTLKDAPKIRQQLTDEQWAADKRDISAEAYQALGMTAMVRKNYPAAIDAFKTSYEAAAHPDPAAAVRLGEAYLNAKQYENAIAAFDKATSAAEVLPQVKQIAEARKAVAEKMKASGGPAAPAPKP